MSDKRTYLDAPLQSGQTVQVSGEIHHYLFRVLRFALHDQLQLFNGDGHDYLGKITHVDKKTAHIELLSSVENHRESPLQITLLQGISKGERMDFVMQKSVELGVNAIYPLLTEHQPLKLSAEGLHKKHLHWQNIISAACAQSGRAIIPHLHPAKHLPEVLNTLNPNLATTATNTEHQQHYLSLAPQATCSLSAWLSDATPHLKTADLPQQHVYLLIGPEGGLSRKEYALASQLGYNSVSIGQRILRTETATLAALSTLQLAWGDF